MQQRFLLEEEQLRQKREAEEKRRLLKEEQLVEERASKSGKGRAGALVERRRASSKTGRAGALVERRSEGALVEGRKLRRKRDADEREFRLMRERKARAGLSTTTGARLQGELDEANAELSTELSNIDFADQSKINDKLHEININDKIANVIVPNASVSKTSFYAPVNVPVKTNLQQRSKIACCSINKPNDVTNDFNCATVNVNELVDSKQSVETVHITLTKKDGADIISNVYECAISRPNQFATVYNCASILCCF